MVALAADPFPVLPVSLLRLWQMLPFCSSDAGIRAYGMLVLIGLVPATIWACRQFGRRAPLLALALLPLNPAVFYHAATNRAYGLAALTTVLCLGAVWRFASAPPRRPAARVLGACGTMVAMLLCVHSNYHNCYILFAIGVAAASCCLLVKQWKRAAVILAMCFLAALSMLPYLSVVSYYWDSVKITQLDRPASEILNQFWLALCGDIRIAAKLQGTPALLVLWWSIAALGISYSVYAVVRRIRGKDAASGTSPHAFALITILVTLAAAYLFVKTSKMYPNVWYFMPVIAVLATMVNVSLQDERPVWLWSAGRSAVAVTIVAFSALPLWNNAHLRRTNLNLIARTVAEQAGPGDLVLVSPFWLSPGFHYYYHGKAPWNCLPMVSATAMESEDQHAAIKEMMTRSDSIGPTLKAVARTLSSGHRLWIVGGVRLRPPNEALPPIPAAPYSPYGWNNNAYTELWSMYLGRFLLQHAQRAQPVQVPVPNVSLKQKLLAAFGAPAREEHIEQPVSDFEDMPLLYFEGWHP